MKAVWVLLCIFSLPFSAFGSPAMKGTGIGTMAVGGLISLYGLISIIGPPTGGDPCREEGEGFRKDGETEDECWDRMDKESERQKRRGYYILPAGLAITGIGWWIFDLGSDGDSVELTADPIHRQLAMNLRITF